MEIQAIVVIIMARRLQVVSQQQSTIIRELQVLPRTVGFVLERYLMNWISLDFVLDFLNFKKVGL